MSAVLDTCALLHWSLSCTVKRLAHIHRSTRDPDSANRKDNHDRSTRSVAIVSAKSIGTEVGNSMDQPSGVQIRMG